MNERIKELWENCDKIYTRYPEQGSPIYASPELLEKFAELIVRECINNVLDSTMEYCGRSQIAEELREHFGVEE